jgi:Papain family cysteine protease
VTSEFLRAFAGRANLSPVETEILEQAGVRSNEDVDSLVRTFPSIVNAGVRLSDVSNAAAMHLSAAYSAVASNVASAPPPVGFGANPPPGSSTTPGTTVGAPPPPPSKAPPASASIDLRVSPWPVRDQGQRGTCVAFGATACVEHLNWPSVAHPRDLSEQFLYWAIKDHSGDPRKTQDGTWLQFARDMFSKDGICDEIHCPYMPMPLNPVSGSAPSAPAKTDASRRKISAATHMVRPSGAAALVLKHLGKNRPVAISVPVFRDPVLPNGPSNWETPVAWAYGRVLNPPIRSVVAGGHCVCVTGFEPDSSEVRGGYFVIRNSWGMGWSRLSPAAGLSHAPEQGYGELSATYVEAYCWELFQL